MTIEQFIRILISNYDNKWPIDILVDHETYANCCQAVFNNLAIDYDYKRDTDVISVCIGKHRGLMFKGVELILKGKDD